MVTISERLFEIMKEKNVSMPDLSRMTGISRHTIFDWQRRGTNPGADKIMVICEALQIKPEELLMGASTVSLSHKTTGIDIGGVKIRSLRYAGAFPMNKKDDYWHMPLCLKT